MRANYGKDITAADIAEEFAISERHINRLFETHFGTPFKRSLNLYRLNYAKNYLVDTGYSIEKIAELVGPPSARALSQLFYSEEGMSAREWRAKWAKGI